MWCWCSRLCSGSLKWPHAGLWRGGTLHGALRQTVSLGHAFPIPEEQPKSACFPQPKTLPSTCSHMAPFLLGASFSLHEGNVMTGPLYLSTAFFIPVYYITFFLHFSTKFLVLKHSRWGGWEKEVKATQIRIETVR